ncbi:MAG: hypothetical protein ACLPKW_29350 [Acetobacteraceae bacterium]|jgi:hypothetical protein
MEHAAWSFLCGCAPATDFVFFARESDDMAARDVAVSTFYNWDEQRPDPTQRWSIYSEVADWRVQGMATIKPASGERTTIALGTRGQYFEVQPASTAQYLGSIAGLNVLVRRVAAIGDVIFAVGMGRSVIRRVRRGTWAEFGPGTTAVDQGQVIGFEGIDGFAPDDIYVAGWGGEIWHWFHGAWQRIDSPTNFNLNAVACDRQNGLVFAVGDNGSMVRGAGDQWDVIDTGRSENLQDVTVFDGEVFVVTDFSILRLEPGGLVPEDRFTGADRPGTCLHLLLAEDGVIAMGPKDMFAFAGGSWRRII